MASSLIESPEGPALVEQQDPRGQWLAAFRAEARRFAWCDRDPAAYPIRFTGREMDGTHSYGGNAHLFLKRGGGSLSVPSAARASTPVHTAGLLFPRSLSGRPPLLLPWLSSANQYIR